MSDTLRADVQDVDLAQEFNALHRSLSAQTDPDEVLEQLTKLARSCVPGSDWVGLTGYRPGRRPTSLAASGEVAAKADEVQDSTGEGPCVSAAEEATTMLLADLASDSLWPQFSTIALQETPVRSVLAVPLETETESAALNLYSADPDDFTEDDERIAAALADHASGLLSHVETARRAAHLARALETSRDIGTAVGVIMATKKVTREEAFVQLVRASQQSNRKLVDLAADVAITGEIPS